MDLEPRGHYSSLREKIQAFGSNLVKFTCATGGLQEFYRGPCFVTRGDNLPNSQVNQIKMG